MSIGIGLDKLTMLATVLRLFLDTTVGLPAGVLRAARLVALLCGVERIQGQLGVVLGIGSTVWW